MPHAQKPRLNTPGSSHSASSSFATSKKRRRLSPPKALSPNPPPSSSAGKSLSLRDLKWTGVKIPSQSLSLGAGRKAGVRDVVDETEGDEDDPFAHLDEGADDFLGLQEVSGVGVRYRGDDKSGKKVEFYEASEPVIEAATIQGPSTPQAAQARGKIKSKAIPFAAGDHTSTKTRAAAINLDGPADKVVTYEEGEDHDYDYDEDGEWQPVASDHEESGSQVNDEVATPMPPAAEQDETIPEGIFSSFVGELPDGDMELQADERIYRATFNDTYLSSWPATVLDHLHPILKKALLRLKFTEPTPVQSATLPLVLPPTHSEPTSGSRDVVALAQTGSGKTLAYALPILQRVLHSRSPVFSSDEQPPLQALIVLPTRELAMQVCEVFQKLVSASTASDDDFGEKLAPWVRIAPVLGGMSEERQWRLLRGRKGAEGQQSGSGKDAEIIIATVGRLWELCKSDDYLPDRLESAQMLVLDEADRLLETGKFQELASILDLLQSPTRQTLMFSATLDPSLQVNLSKSRSKVSRALKKSKEGDKMVKLLQRVGFTDPEGAQVIDLTKNALVSESLKEGKIECVEKEKDLYLYYLLLRYSGSTLVFMNSIDSVRRLQPLLSNLGLNTYPLHGDMDQRSRLRSLDNFKKSIDSKKATSSSSSVLLATDVAARGLDIPLVSHVVHFHLPRAADTYIHRSGRTARAGQRGLSLVLLGPSEKTRWASLRKSLRREGDLQDLEVMYGIMSRLKKRIALAKELDELRHRERKEKAEGDWLRKIAEEADLALDDQEIDPDADFHVSGGGGGARSGGKSAKANRAAIKSLEAELREELKMDLLVRGVKRKFITQGGGLGLGNEEALRGLIDGSGHETFLGMVKSKAEEDLGSKAAKSRREKKGK